MSHLYIMQNQFGFIKVGRSVNVEARRRGLERTDDCVIIVVTVIEDAGDFEETMLENLGDHRLIGEWFEGDDLCRDCVALEVQELSKVLGKAWPKITWPYDLADEERANAWIDLCERRRVVASIDKQFQRRIRDMSREGESGIPDPSRYHDTAIWTSLWRFEKQVGTLVSADKGKDGEIVLKGYREDTSDVEAIPCYTRDVSAAMDLWPDEDRPETWRGTAWDCCIAALKARKARLLRP